MQNTENFHWIHKLYVYCIVYLFFHYIVIYIRERERKMLLLFIIQNTDRSILFFKYILTN